MTQASKIEIPVEEATAAALSDVRRREAVGRLVDRLADQGGAQHEAGLAEAEVEAELAAYNTERRV